MLPAQIVVTFPAEFRARAIYGEVYSEPRKYDKITVIRAVRMLTGWGLKDSKDASERSDPVSLPVYPSLLESAYDEAMGLFQLNGVKIEKIEENYRAKVTDTLEKLAIEAIGNKDFEMAKKLLIFIQDNV